MTDEERKKLVADLREYANDLTFEGTIAKDAADEIERLAAKVEELEMQRNTQDIEREKHEERRRCAALEGRDYD